MGGESLLCAAHGYQRAGVSVFLTTPNVGHLYHVTLGEDMQGGNTHVTIISMGHSNKYT